LIQYISAVLTVWYKQKERERESEKKSKFDWD